MISAIGKEMLEFQDKLAKQYSYKVISPLIAKINMEKYYTTIPSIFQGTKHPTNEKPGFYIDGKDIELYSDVGTKIATKYDRIVIGHYGAFIEIDQNDIIKENIRCTPGQEYRMSDPAYSQRVKYFWMTAKDTSNCKLYWQQREVAYADYKPFKWYISPFEVIINTQVL